MKKKFVTYVQYGRSKKAVLDENLYKQYSQDPSITEMVEYETESLMERRFAEKAGKGGNSTLLFG